MAQCAEVDPLVTFKNAHGGSGYDLACAKADGPITYQLIDNKAKVLNTTIPFDFLDELGFVYRGKKQLTSESLNLVKNKPFSDDQIDRFNSLTDAFLQSKSLLELEDVIEEHESLLAEHLGLTKVKHELFGELPGQVKALVDGVEILCSLLVFVLLSNGSNKRGLQQSFLSQNWDLFAPRIGHNIW